MAGVWSSCYGSLQNVSQKRPCVFQMSSPLGYGVFLEPPARIVPSASVAARRDELIINFTDEARYTNRGALTLQTQARRG